MTIQFVRAHKRVIKRNLILPNRTVIVREHNRSTNTPIKDIIRTGKKVYDVAETFSDANTLIKGSPEDKFDTAVGIAIPSYKFVKLGKKVFRKRVL